MEEYKSFELRNGFKVFYQKNNSGRIFGNLRVHHGALNELPGEEGTAHFLEHMFIEAGSKRYSPEEQAKLRDELGFTNAFTSQTETSIPMGFLPEDFETFLDFSSDMMFNPVFDQQVLAAQKNIVSREIAKKKGRPDFEDMKRHWNELYRNGQHHYFVLGERTAIEGLDVDKLEDFRKRGYHANNADLVLSGELPDNVEGIVGEHFGTVAKGCGKRFEYPFVGSLEGQTVSHVHAPDLLNKSDPSESNSDVFIHFVVPSENHEDSAALRLAAKMLCGSKAMGVYKRVRTDKGLSYALGGGYNGRDNAGIVKLHMNVLAREQDRAIDMYFDEIGKMKELGVDQEFLERAKKKTSYGLAAPMKRIWNRFIMVDPVNVGAVARISEDVISDVSLEKKLQDTANVTTEDIQRVAREYFPVGRDDGNYVMLIRDPLKK